MNVVLIRMWRRASSHSTWLLPLLIAAFVFVTSWALMALAQPGSDIVRPENYWWYFLITTTTVGYGDFFPETATGKVVGAYVVAGGLTTIAVLISQVGTAIENKRGRRMQGQVGYAGSDHIVILGYTPGRTDRLIEELHADEPGRHVVLCAWDDQLAEHPFPADPRITFVRGDLAETDVLERAGMAGARAVLVDARDDHEAVTLTVAAAVVAPETHTVVALRDLRRSRTVHRVDETAHCVQWHTTQMIVEELQDPGIALVYAELTTPGGASTYSGTVPEETGDATYGDWMAALGRAHRCTLLAVQDGAEVRVSPPWDTPVRPGHRLFYVATRRLTGAELTAALT